MNEPQRYSPELHQQRLNAPPQSAEAAWTYGPPHTHTYAQPPARRKRRVFLWVFLAVQVLFLIWIIAGAASGHSAAVNCHDQYLTHQQCADATDAGTAIGVGLVIALWVAADVILGVGYMIYRLSRRNSLT